MIGMRDDEFQSKPTSKTVQQVQQDNRIRATRDCDERLSGFAEEPGRSNVRQRARGQRLGSGHVS